MSFFTVDRSLANEEDLAAKKHSKLRYVVDSDGKGRWIKPVPPLPIDYDEDIIY